MSSDPHIPGYTIVSKIADGGMATVWKARQDKLDRVVAIKVLSKEVNVNHGDYQRFIYEARAAASLIHPNIVQVIDAGEQDGFMYYIMEYVPGPTAGDAVSTGTPMEEGRILQIGLEVAEALEYAWRDHHVVHCDIKPENLLLHRNGRTKVADLGLAQVLGGERGERGERVEMDEGMTMGTPNYFAPEQALVEEGLDCRADMYALGATLYHLATGMIPFGDMEPDEVASEQVHGQLEHPRDLNPELSYGFCCLIRRLMAKEAEDRYEDWRGVMADILAVKEGRMIGHPLPAEVTSTIRFRPIPKEVLSIRKGPVRRVRVRGTRKGGVSHPRPSVPLEPAGSIWPLVTGLSIVVLFLYAFTIFRSLK